MFYNIDQKHKKIVLSLTEEKVAEIGPERSSNDKHIIFLGLLINYGRKKFYNIGSRMGNEIAVSGVTGNDLQV